MIDKDHDVINLYVCVCVCVYTGEHTQTLVSSQRGLFC